MEEVAESGRKAIVFSQWVEPLQILAGKLSAYKPLQPHDQLKDVLHPDRVAEFVEMTTPSSSAIARRWAGVVHFQVAVSFGRQVRLDHVLVGLRMLSDACKSAMCWAACRAECGPRR